MRSNTAAQLLKVIARLVKQDAKELLNSDFLGVMSSAAITTYRANYNVKINGRRWLAPLYRPLTTTFNIKKGSFITVRENRTTVDVDSTADGEAVVFTVKLQDWKEKQGYFLEIPSNRIRGRLAITVKHIIRARKQSNG